MNSEYRLTHIRRKLNDLLMARRLSEDPEKTGVVELADFGKRCEKIAAFAKETQEQFSGRVQVVAEELELAARLAAMLETLPRTTERFNKQTGLLEEVSRMLDAQDEPAVLMSLSVLAGQERALFTGLVEFDGVIHESPPGMVDRGALRRELRRALLDHDEIDGLFALEVAKDGTLRFCGEEFRAESTGAGLARSAAEPPEVKRALDMYEITPDESLKSFLLVKAVDEALAAVLVPQLSSSALVSLARQLPTRPGKRRVVRPEAVQRKVDGWDNAEAARAAEKLAAQRIGPDWARLPRGAYLLRLFLSGSDALAADLLALGATLKRMEKGVETEEVEGMDETALRALSGLLRLLDGSV